MSENYCRPHCISRNEVQPSSNLDIVVPWTWAWHPFQDSTVSSQSLGCFGEPEGAAAWWRWPSGEPGRGSKTECLASQHPVDMDKITAKWTCPSGLPHLVYVLLLLELIMGVLSVSAPRSHAARSLTVRLPVISVSREVSQIRHQTLISPSFPC